MFKRNALLGLFLLLLPSYVPMTNAMLSKFKRPSEPKKTLHQAYIDQLFLSACEIGDLDLVKRSVEQLGADRDARCENGYTARHNAAYNGHLHVLQYLLQDRDYPEDNGNNELTPFHLALNGDHIDILRWYCEEKDIDIDYTDDEGVKLLHLATFHGSEKSLRYLIKKTTHFKNQVQVLQESFSVACKIGKFGCAKILLSYVDINKPSEESQMTLLYFLAGIGNFDAVKFLVENGADPELPTKGGFRATQVAQAGGFYNIVDYLEKYSLSKKLQTELIASENEAKELKKSLKTACALKPLNRVHVDTKDVDSSMAPNITGKENKNPQKVIAPLMSSSKPKTFSIKDFIHIRDDRKGYKKSSVFLFAHKTALQPGTYYNTSDGLDGFVEIQQSLDNIGTQLSQNHLVHADYSEHVKRKMTLPNDVFHNFSSLIEKKYGDSALTKVIDFKLHPHKKQYWEKQLGATNPIANRWFELHCQIPAQIRPAGFSVEKAKNQGPTGNIKYIVLAEGLGDNHAKTIVHRCFELDKK